MSKKINRKDAIIYLGISDKSFDNYSKYSKEIIGIKERGRWYFNVGDLDNWKSLRKSRTIRLALSEYEKCFEFAIKMVYGGLSLHGIRGKRSEVQAADDVILGILAEHGIKKFLRNKFRTEIKLDEAVHPEEITPQDFDRIKDKESGKLREPKMGVGVKASKIKSAFLVLGSNEVELADRKSDVYIFARVDLPSDHLFRILRDHSFFGKLRIFFENNKKFRQIEQLQSIPIWICGFVYVNELDRATSIPGQEFSNGYRYVKSVSQLHNSDEDWKKLMLKL